MFDYNDDSKIKKREKDTQYDNQFWDRLVRVLFVLGVVIILLTVAIKWLGFLD